MKWDKEKEQYLIDNYSRMTMQDIASELGMTKKAIYHQATKLRKRGILSLDKRFYMAWWNERQRDYLNNNWGLKSDRAVASVVKKTVRACAGQAKNMGINRKVNIYTAATVAGIFGIDGQTVRDKLIGGGWLEAKKCGYRSGKYRAWNVDYDSLVSFIENTVWLYDYRKMPVCPDNMYFRELAEQAWKADPWVTIEDSIDDFGYTWRTILNWIHRGVIDYRYQMKYQRGGYKLGTMVFRKADIPEAVRRIKKIKHKNISRAAKERTRRENGWGRSIKRDG